MNEKKACPEKNTLDMEIIESGYTILDERWHYENECNPFSRLYFVKRGSGYLREGEKEIRLSGGYVYLIPADCEFSYGCSELEKIFFHISLTTAEKYELFSGLKKIYSLPFSKAETDELFECYFSDNYMDFLRLKAILYRTAARFSKEYNFPPEPIKKYSETVEKTMRFIQENVRINLSVKEVSKELFISESKIRKAFFDETGRTVGTYIDDLVFAESKKRLVRENTPIKDISRELGFCDQFYFSRSFKKHSGRTPSEYRNDKGV